MADRILVSRNTPPVKLVTGKSHKVAAVKDQAYQVVDLAAPAGEAPADPAKLSKEGADLQINYPDGTSLTMTDFFVVCPGGACTVTLADGSQTGQVVTAGAIAAGGEGLGFWGWTAIVGGGAALAAAAGGGGGGGGTAPANDAPVLTGSTPADNATGILPGSNIVLTFSEMVAAGTGNIVISNGTDTRTISVTDASQVAISGNTVTINPTASLQSGSLYNVQMVSGVLKDAAGAAFAGITSPTALDFRTEDLTAPSLVSSAPADNAASVLVGSNIVLTFSKNVVAGTGNIVISDGSDTRTISIADASQITISGSTVTINPASNLLANRHYEIQMASGVLLDGLGSPFAGIGSAELDFDTQDLIAPTLISSVPGDNATAVWVGNNLVLTFSEALVAGPGNIEISNGVDTRTIAASDTSQVTISGNTVTVDPSAHLLESSHYAVRIAANAFRDVSGNPFAGIFSDSVLDFYTQDVTTPTLIGSVPSDDEKDILVGTSVVLTFSEPVVAGSGSIVISNGSDTRTISITDTSQVTISGNTVTISPATDLQSNSHYNVQMSSGVVRDAAGNAFAGITTSTGLDFETQDLVAPTLTASVPADNALTVQVASNITLVFSEDVVAGIGNIVISDGTDARTISVADTTQVTINGNTVTINPTDDLAGPSHYSVQVDAGAFLDLAGNVYAGIASATQLDFDTQDPSAPFLVTTSPADNASAVSVGGNIVLTFNESVVAGSGNILISNGTDTRTISVTDTSQVTFSGNTVTINPSTDLLPNSHYDVQFTSGVIEDLAGNPFAGIVMATALDFDTPDTIAPALMASTPSDNATAVLVGGNISLIFSEGVVAGSGNIIISNGADTRSISVTDTSQVSIVGNTVTINPAVNLQSNSHYNVQLASGVIRDAAGNAFAGITTATGLDFETQDLIAPTLSGSTPADNATAVLIGGNIVLAFSEPVVAGSGSIVISNGSDTRTISITDTSQVTISGNTVTISPATDLQSNSHYNVQMSSGVVRDAAGNAFAGITTSTGLDFETQDLVAPTLTSSAPADNSVSVQVSSNVVLAFSETVVAGSGDILISNGADIRTISVTDAMQVSITGNTVTINPISDLQSNSHYNVQMSGGVILDSAGNVFAGITSATALDFDTQDLIAPVLSGSAPADGAVAVLVGESISLTFSEDVAAGVGSIVVSNGADVRTIDVSDAGQVTISGNVVTINPVADLQSNSHYSVQIASGVFVDLSGNAFPGMSGGTGLDFETQDLSSPTLIASSPGNGSTAVLIESDIVLTFSESVVASSGDIVITDGTDTRVVSVTDASQVTVSGDTVTIDLFADLHSNSQYSVQIASGVIRDLAGNAFAGISAGTGLGFETQDLVAPVLISSSPVSGAGGVAGDTDIVLNFSEAVFAGVGSIIIRSASGDVRNISVTDASQVSISGATVTISPSVVLEGNGSYSVEIAPGVLFDAAGNEFLGLGGGELSIETAGTPVELAQIGLGVDGLLITPISSSQYSHGNISVGIGDVNGDGFDDVLTARLSIVTGGIAVVFGRSAGGAIDLDDLESSADGFIINGANQSSASINVSSVSGAGDMNGDGLSDILLGVSDYTQPQSGRGQTYVVFGRADTFPVELSAIANGVGGFVIDGQCDYDQSGYSAASAGDINGDGFQDILIGAPYADPEGRQSAGSSYVVYGCADVRTVRLSDVALGCGGFAIHGDSAGDSSGYSVSAAGDVNGDGFADILIGAPSAEALGVSYGTGRTYVVFGGGSFGSNALSSIAAGVGGFVINGQSGSDSGASVSLLGDVNGDGLSDLLVGGPGFDASPTTGAGRCYVIFGRTTTSPVELSAVAEGVGGYAINGASWNNQIGVAVSNAGDFNGDGLADLIVGAPYTDAAGFINAGETYVVFGKSGSANVDLSQVALGSGGFVIHGEGVENRSGSHVSAGGDINGDGLADLIVSARYSYSVAAWGQGRTYIVFGTTRNEIAHTSVDLYGGDGADSFTDMGLSKTIVSGAGNDVLTASGASVLYGGSGNDLFAIDSQMITALENPLGTAGNLDRLARVDGGTGTDTLSLPGGGLALDLTRVASQAGGALSAGSRISSVERIDLTGAGNNTLTLSAMDVSDLVGFNTLDLPNWAGVGVHQLLVDGNAGDQLILQGQWQLAGTIQHAGQTYSVYGSAAGSVHVIADADIQVDAVLDDIAPVYVGSSPGSNGANVQIDSNIVLNFSEAVEAGSGNLILSNGVDTRTISIADSSQVSISGNSLVIDLSADLQSNSRYTIEADAGIVLDSSGSSFFGLSGLRALEFTTQDLKGPELLSVLPADNATAVPVDGHIVLSFDERVRPGSGTIVITSGTDIRTIGVTDASQVTVTDYTVTINPLANLRPDRHYNVQISAGALTDALGNQFAGISGDTALDFDTGGAVVDLSAIAAGNFGFVVNWDSLNDGTGQGVSAVGDVNGDGLGDFIVGAPGGDSAAAMGAGLTYVIFGKTGTLSINLSAVAAGVEQGFVINGQCTGDGSGFSLSGVGDVNGDGLPDLLIGVPQGDPSNRTSAGRSYIVFGKTDLLPVDLSAVAAGTGGYAINGQSSGDSSGYSVSAAGDINGDGLADIVVGAYGSDYGGSSKGRSYVVFGKTGSSEINLSAIAAGIGGFAINGQMSGDSSGISVAGAGDVNGDGLADVIIGASGSDPGAMESAGRSYIVFGKTDTAAVNLSAVDAALGGFVIEGRSSSDGVGRRVSMAGDVNGDGLADLLVSASSASSTSVAGAGLSYVVFGQTAGSRISLSTLDAGSGGFVIVGQSAYDNSGSAISSAGDINGDGLADLIVGAPSADPAGGVSAGRSYVIYGRTSSSTVELSAIAAGIGGFVINGHGSSEGSGASVSAAGDVNGDGLADLLVGAPYGWSSAGGTGKAYVIFGRTGGAFSDTRVDQYGTSEADQFTDGGSAQTLVTGLGDDTLSAAAASVLYGGAGNDLFNIGSGMIIALQSEKGVGGNGAQLSRIDGGTGLDTISLSGSGLTLDLTLVANQAASSPDGGSRIDSIERIDLTGTGNNTLKLQLRDVLDMGSANTFVTTGRQQLLVTGNTGDSLDIADGTGTAGWTQSGTASISAVSYNVWNHNTSLATIYVNPNITVV